MLPVGSIPLITCIGGSSRADSTTERALRVTAKIVESLGARVEVFAGQELILPMYAPENPERSPIARALIQSLRACDGVILASAGYHGAISGLVKNALDYTEDMAKDASPYLHGRAVGCIAVANRWQMTGTTLVSLRSVVHALRGWPTPLGVAINATIEAFNKEGQCIAPDLERNLRTLAEQVVEFARMRSFFERMLPQVQPGYVEDALMNFYGAVPEHLQ
jgi:FMN reductase